MIPWCLLPAIKRKITECRQPARPISAGWKPCDAPASWMRVADGLWRVPDDLAERGRQYDSQRLGGVAVELKSHLPIELQARVIGATWLDQQFNVAKLQRPSIYTRMLLTANFYPDSICLEACSSENAQGHHVVGLGWIVDMSIHRGALKPVADAIFELEESRSQG